MSYIYQVGYTSYEDSELSELIHKNKYSKEEFHSIISNAIIRVLRGIVSKKYKTYIHNDGISYRSGVKG